MIYDVAYLFIYFFIIYISSLEGAYYFQFLLFILYKWFIYTDLNTDIVKSQWVNPQAPNKQTAREMILSCNRRTTSLSAWESSFNISTNTGTPKSVIRYWFEKAIDSRAADLWVWQDTPCYRKTLRVFSILDLPQYATKETQHTSMKPQQPQAHGRKQQLWWGLLMRWKVKGTVWAQP